MNQQHQPSRSILENISFSITGFANMIGSATSAVATVAETCDTLAGTGLVMAENVQEVTVIESQGKKQAKLEELWERYPALKPTPAQKAARTKATK